jgi:hypothetical protein
MLHDMSLRDLGARVHLYDEEGGNVGVAHAPKPVGIGDALAIEGATFRVTDLIDRIPGGNVDVLAVVEPVRLPVASTDPDMPRAGLAPALNDKCGNVTVPAPRKRRAAWSRARSSRRPSLGRRLRRPRCTPASLHSLFA